MKATNISGHECIFDDEANIADLSVCTKPDGYKTLVYSAGPHKAQLYCRVLLSASKGIEVDHINGNTLDNRIENLRLVTSQQNKFNQIKRKNSSPLPKGVCKHGTGYRAAITINYTTYNLGTYPTPELAEAAYKRKAEEYFGEHALHNSREQLK